MNYGNNQKRRERKVRFLEAKSRGKQRAIAVAQQPGDRENGGGGEEAESAVRTQPKVIRGQYVIGVVFKNKEGEMQTITNPQILNDALAGRPLTLRHKNGVDVYELEASQDIRANSPPPPSKALPGLPGNVNSERVSPGGVILP